MKKIEEILKETTEENQHKVDWTAAWSGKYPVLKTYLTNNKNKQMTSAYSTGQNVRYMISLALRRRPSVLVFALVISVTAILNSLAQLFIVPSVLRAVENKETVLYLSGIIILFTLSLMILGAAGAYFASCSQFGRVEVRLGFLAGEDGEMHHDEQNPDVKELLKLVNGLSSEEFQLVLGSVENMVRFANLKKRVV